MRPKSTLRFISGLFAIFLGLSAYYLHSWAGEQTGGAESEITHVTVGVLNVSDAAPLYIAIKDGIFTKYGLFVQTTPAPGAAQATAGLVSGGMQFAFGSYVPFILAAQKGINLRLAAPADNTSDTYSQVVVSKDGLIKSVADLKGKKIAVSALANFGTLAIQETLRHEGVSPSDVTFVTIPFPNMGVAIAHGQVDAAWLVEPFLTEVRDSGKTRDLFNPFSGTMESIPAAGYMMTAKYAKSHPKVAAAFRHAMAEASAKASSNPAIVRDIIPTFTKIPTATAGKIGLPEYTSILKPTALQHIADVMVSDDLIKSKFDTSVFFGNALN